MQTFLPHPSFVASAAVLDRARLGKQRVEAAQLLSGILGHRTGGWARHPASLMWRNHPDALGVYYSVVCNEWERRGYAQRMWTPYDALLGLRAPAGAVGWSAFLTERAWPPATAAAMPAWLGDPALHASHRSNLLRKDPDWYGAHGWTEPHDLPYVWPVSSSRSVAASVE